MVTYVSLYYGLVPTYPTIYTSLTCTCGRMHFMYPRPGHRGDCKMQIERLSGGMYNHIIMAVTSTHIMLQQGSSLFQCKQSFCGDAVSHAKLYQKRMKRALWMTCWKSYVYIMCNVFIQTSCKEVHSMCPSHLVYIYI